MEKLIRSMAEMVDNEQAEGYLVAGCIKDASGDYQIMAGARTSKNFPNPYPIYAGLLGRLFHTITQGHPEPKKILEKVIQRAVEEYNQTVQEESQAIGEFTVIGKL
jgi:hypothetical protein